MTKTPITLESAAQMGGASLLTVAETAEALRLDKRTLENWRSLGKGPRATRIGTRRIAYRVRDVLAFVEGEMFAA